MHLHLFSTPGRDDLRYVIEASRPYLEGKDEAVVAYMPLASLYAEKWHPLNYRAFEGLGRLVEINAELMTQKEIENVIREAALVYDNPVIMLCDGAYIKMDGKKTSLVRGEAYIMRKDREKERLEEGTVINFSRTRN